MLLQYSKLLTYQKLWKKVQQTLDEGFEALHTDFDVHTRLVYENPQYVFLVGECNPAAHLKRG